MNARPRQELCELVKAEPDLYENRARCEGLLRDSFGSYKLEVQLLCDAIREHVPSELRGQKGSVPQQILLVRLTRRLQDNRGLSEDNAKWAVESWALALGVVREADLRPRTERKPPPPPPEEPPRDGRGASNNISDSKKLDPPPPPVVPSASDWSGRTWLILVAVAFAALVAFLRLASHPDAPGTRSQLVNPPGPAQPAAPHCDPYGFNSTCPELRLSGPHTPPAPQLGSP